MMRPGGNTTGTFMNRDIGVLDELTLDDTA
jgi:hypothetical protein